MAVHLNARLRTQFIPAIFALASATAMASVFFSRAHASSPAAAQDFSALTPLLTLEEGETISVARDEVQRALEEGTDPARVDRRPGFSKITYTLPGEQPPESSDPRALAAPSLEDAGEPVDSP